MNYMQRGTLSFFVLLLAGGGCILSTTNKFTADGYNVSYPDDYTVSQTKEGVTVMEGENGRVEIFKETQTGLRLSGSSSSGLDEFEWKLSPKEEKQIGEYTVWSFYPSDNQSAKKEIESIVQSLEII